MKITIKLLTLSLFLNTYVFAQCPVKGDKPLPKFEHLDSLKNRNYVGTIDSSVSLQTILTKVNDEKRFKTSQFVKLTGYVILVKAGGSETCNCHSKDPNDLDIHIELGLNIGDKPTQAVIVEINRFTKLTHPEYTVANLKKILLNKKVVVEGWLFFDEEHKQNAVNTNPNGTNLWRATCWEVHPVLIINIVK